MIESPRDKMTEEQAKRFDALMQFTKPFIVADVIHLAEHNASFRSRIRHVWEILEESIMRQATRTSNEDSLEHVIWLRSEIGKALNKVGTR